MSGRHAPRRRPRVLMIIAPSLWECHETALAYGLNPRVMEDVRYVTKPEQLRGLRPGTPFIAKGRDHWAETPTGWSLGEMVDLKLRIGELRLAQDDDIDACRGEMREAAE